jgi:probable HAF family extracellular repeat protein
VAILWLARLESAPTAETYTVTNIGAALGGNSSAALALNNLGDVVGTYGDNFSVPYKAFIFSNGVATPIAPHNHFSIAYGINDARQVTGSFQEVPSPEVYAFLYQNGVFTSLGTFNNNPGGQSVGYGINQQGTIVGIVQTPSIKGMVYENGAMTTFNNSNVLRALAVNNTGSIVGDLQNNHAFLLSGGRVQDLGTLDGSRDAVSASTAVNDAGQVVGYSYFSGNAIVHAFLYENGVLKDLGTLRGGYSMALGINNNGDIVGVSDGSAFLYRNGVMIDLQAATSDGSTFFGLSTAVAINGRGQIAGTGTFANIGTHAVLLTPQ